MPLILRDFERTLETFAPKELKEDYDNVGLMIGSMDSPVEKVLVALDCTKDVILEAIDNNCSLIFTHHPLLFRPLKNIDYDSLTGGMVFKLIENHIGLYSSHTNADKAFGGINDILVNMLFPKSLQNRVIEGGDKYGIGRMATLTKPIDLASLLQKIKKELEAPVIRFCGDLDATVKRIAVINGSGEDYINRAIDMGADCVITGDTSYHPISDAKEKNIPIIDAGHFNTEWKAFILFSKILEERLKEKDPSVTFYISSISKDPYKYI